MKKRPARLRWLIRVRRTLRHMPRRLLLIAGAAVLVIALVITGVSLLTRGGSKAALVRPTGTPKPLVRATNPSVALPPRATPNPVPAVTPETNPCRDISIGAKDIQFAEKQINQPAISGKELFFSAGTGSLDSAVLTKLYLYNFDTGAEKKISDAKIKGGEFYETQINENWMVWLETDHHTFNYIYVKARKDKDGKPTDNGTVTQIKNCKNGKPKLKLSGNTLVWMEQVDKGTDKLIMFDLTTQENLTLFTFKDVATYGVSAPSVYEDTSGGDAADDKTTIVWAGPDPKQTADQAKTQGARSAIFWLDLGADAINEDGTVNSKSFSTGTYVHEPLYNGKYFVWIDGNYSPNSKLYLSEPNGKPKVIAEGVTTYGLGDDIVVFGMQQQVWAYVIDTGEMCRLTGNNEIGILPNVEGRTVAWLDKSADSSKDTLKYKVLTDEDLLPGKAK